MTSSLHCFSSFPGCEGGVYQLLAVLLSACTLLACQNTPLPDSTMPDTALRDDLATVSRLKVFFGHQSVGQNVIDGLKDLAAANGVSSFRFVSADNMPGDGQGYFADTHIGENHYPIGKCEDFRRVVDRFRQNPPDVAFMKFCYSDIERDSDVQAIFARYCATMDSLKAALSAGADAVYLGGKRFGARHFAPNFSDEELAGAIELSHSRSTLVYVTVNTLIKESEMKEALDYVARLERMGADAVIVQDRGLMAMVKERLRIAVHASTQMGIHTADGAIWPTHDLAKWPFSLTRSEEDLECPDNRGVRYA